ncbi:hypothetical protein QJQ45_000960 [Haematococcus lacustris]|nr:hypothetical protein QJQ45_000960 [Haematococcus lacustris]
MVESLRLVFASTKPAPGGQRTTHQQLCNTALAMTLGRGVVQHGIKTTAKHWQRGHIMLQRYLVLDDARQAAVCSMPEAGVERMHDDVERCRAMHRMVFTPDREQPQWAMAGCACSTCMSVPCLPCMKPDNTTPLVPMPMSQDTVKEVEYDRECYELLMRFHPELMHDEVGWGKLATTHCVQYCNGGGDPMWSPRLWGSPNAVLADR